MDEEKTIEDFSEPMTSDTYDNSIVSPSRDEDIDDVVSPLIDDVKDDVRDGADANNRAIVMDYTAQFTTNEQWASREDMKSWVTSLAIEHVMVIVVLRSDKGRVTLQCEKSGVYREPKYGIQILVREHGHVSRFEAYHITKSSTSVTRPKKVK
ncbi:hypothetical protein CASFOL_000456 [Castilleja foliolosa]|uniref:Uncharacterized protein n=1 Tax=Castilleja foliolosa TaxID=1961234 RepID=A0ABD3EPF4_9LAMI